MSFLVTWHLVMAVGELMCCHKSEYFRRNRRSYTGSQWRGYRGMSQTEVKNEYHRGRLKSDVIERGFIGYHRENLYSNVTERVYRGMS